MNRQNIRSHLQNSDKKIWIYQTRQNCNINIQSSIVTLQIHNSNQQVVRILIFLYKVCHNSTVQGESKSVTLFIYFFNKSRLHETKKQSKDKLNILACLDQHQLLFSSESILKLRSYSHRAIESIIKSQTCTNSQHRRECWPVTHLSSVDNLRWVCSILPVINARPEIYKGSVTVISSFTKYKMGTAQKKY